MFKKIKSLAGMMSGGKDSLTKQTLMNSGYSLMINIVSKIGGIIFTILLARMLLPDLFGLYSLAISIIVTIGTFADLGVNTALMRYMSESVAKGKRGMIEARSRLRFFLNIKVIITLITCAVLFFGSSIISNLIFKKPELLIPMQIGALYVFAMAIQAFLSSVFMSIRKMKCNLFSEIIFQLSRIGLFVMFIQAYKSVSSVLFAVSLAFIISALVYICVLMINHKFLIVGRRDRIKTKGIVAFIGWTTLSAILISLFVSINTFMLGFFVDAKFIAYFATIFSIVMPVASIINLTAIFLPVFTSIGGERLARGFKKTMKFSSMFGIPAAFGLSFIIFPLIRIVYGIDYFPDVYYRPLLISAILLCFIIPVEIFNSIYTTLLISKKQVKKVVYLLGFATLANIALNYAFIKIALPYGMIWALAGVSLATVLTRYACFFALAAMVKKDFGFPMYKKDNILPIISSLIMLGFLFLFNHIFNPGIWLSVLMIALAAGVYFIAFFMLNRIRFRKHFKSQQVFS